MPVTKEQIEKAVNDLWSYAPLPYGDVDIQREFFKKHARKLLRRLLKGNKKGRPESGTPSVMPPEPTRRERKLIADVHRLKTLVELAQQEIDKLKDRPDPLAKLERLAVECPSKTVVLARFADQLWGVTQGAGLAAKPFGYYKTPQEAIDAGGEREEEEKC